MRLTKAVVLALLLSAPCVLHFVAPPQAAAAGSDAQQKKRLKDLQTKNAQLRAELSRKNAESQQAFAQATAAENAAGIRALSCHGVASAAVPATYPVSGVVHARLRVKRGVYSLAPTFSPARAVGSFRLHEAKCAALKQ